MLNKYIFFLGFLLQVFVYAQTNDSISEKIAEQGAFTPDENNHAAELVGGTSVFIKKFQENFRIKKVKNEGKNQLVGLVIMVIEKDGRMSNIDIKTDNESFREEILRALKKNTGEWKPGLLNGEPVRSRIRFPLRINFD